MEQQQDKKGINQSVHEELADYTLWADTGTCSVLWALAPGSFDHDEFMMAKRDGKGEEFVKSNYTFYVPVSQMTNKKMWIYRDANKSAKGQE
ncbi:hypothetical protein BGW38_001778 [Lunasporangiospora selenospora]|uniref:Uncharacterized protein n=1 Tax=Lunasporangiospora selenospora TaxID=979761 RepID=A0A9P6FTU6_9FUNG|nr:hypothetical protein BGW38_001778 [Lunasporangiospora selenospora]